MDDVGHLHDGHTTGAQCGQLLVDEWRDIDGAWPLFKLLEAFRAFFLVDRPFVGGDKPSIADIRWAVTLEFLRAIDYEFPRWAEEYLRRVEESLGEAYSEPAADVRGYVASVKSPA